MLFSESSRSILVVGAGPTGLALAAELHRLGVSPIVIDRHPAGANTSRACVVHAATLEALEPLGATADLLELGVKVPIFRIRDRDRILATIDFSGLKTPYPFTLMCPQNRIEACLEERLRSVGGHVHRGCELVGFTEDGRHVDATIRTDGSERRLRARWLVGCDGMHSLVREGSAIPFSGGQYRQDFILADVRMDWPIDTNEVTLFYSPAGLMVVAPLPGGRYRIVATVDHAPHELGSDLIQDIARERGPESAPALIHDIAWSSRFHIHHRVADTPRKGRILLCGDSAHVHSPAGGQGMNTGIQDAVSLARVLAAGADDTLLDDWARERHRVAAGVVALTDRMTRIATIKSHPAQLLRNWAVELAGHVPAVRTRLARSLAELEDG